MLSVYVVPACCLLHDFGSVHVMKSYAYYCLCCRATEMVLWCIRTQRGT